MKLLAVAREVRPGVRPPEFLNQVALRAAHDCGDTTNVNSVASRPADRTSAVEDDVVAAGSPADEVAAATTVESFGARASAYDVIASPAVHAFHTRDSVPFAERARAAALQVDA